MTWEEALAAIGKLGFRRADLAMFEGWTHVSPSQLTDPGDHGRKIAAACARLRVEPIAVHANFAVGDRKTFPGLTTPDADARKTILAHFDRVLACAREAEIPLVNVQPGKFQNGMPRRDCLENAIALLRPMQERAARQEVVLSFENHTGSVGEKPEDCLALLEAVPGLRLDFDFSHVVACGVPLEQTRPLWKHVAHVGVRNAKRGSFNEPVRDGRLDYDVAGLLDALRDARVDAFVSVEYYEPRMRDHVGPLKAILEQNRVANPAG
jgi:sugar phosphate isomerase/epimerase